MRPHLQELVAGAIAVAGNCTLNAPSIGLPVREFH